MNEPIFSDKKKLENIINSIISGWSENLHFLVDFDNTLTKSFINWKPTPSLLWVLRDYPEILWEDFAQKDTALFEKYHPQEVDPSIEMKEKNSIMEEWWKSTFWLLIDSWLTKEKIKETVELWNIEFRDWTKEMLKILNNLNIPLIIISANWIWKGSMEYFFEKNNCYYDNIKIISNDFEWDNFWKALNYKTPIIHSFNKSEVVLKEDKKLYSEIENRKNVILLWDSLWDHHMIDWFNYNNLLKLWFLNNNFDKLINEYKKRYDIIQKFDWDFEIINDLLKKLK